MSQWAFVSFSLSLVPCNASQYHTWSPFDSCITGHPSDLSKPPPTIYIAGGFEIRGTFVRGLGSMNPTIGRLFFGA